MTIPRLIHFQHIGEPEVGYISVAESFSSVPFEIKRVYWVYETPDEVERGNHANKIAEHVVVCLKGKVTIDLEHYTGEKFQFVLTDPNQGIFIPALYWRKLRMTKDTVCLSLSSTLYDEEDYIREYEDFFKLRIKE